jgi:hypothetical protein
MESSTTFLKRCFQPKYFFMVSKETWLTLGDHPKAGIRYHFKTGHRE